ncbi:MAG: hypothetical protein E4H09_02530 [Spirochaetales bacterium]|nr:MAG: hypothetical protein E4H09_02530 [Spirochaetales bacterium]
MTLARIQETLSAVYLTDNPPLSREVSVGCASDLMSDVLAFSQTQAVLLTGLTGPQSVRTAEIADIAAVCFVFGKQPPAETIELANKSGVPLLVSPFTLYVASGKLYEIGLPGCHAE